MNRAVILAFVRHLLTTLGGSAVSYGYLTEGQVPEVVGGIMALIGLALSIHDKFSRDAAQPPGAAPLKLGLLLAALGAPLLLAACSATPTQQQQLIAATPAGIACAATIVQAVTAQAEADGEAAARALAGATAVLTPDCVAALQAALAALAALSASDAAPTPPAAE